MQDDHFSYKSCYQNESCLNIKNEILKSYMRNREIIHLKRDKRTKTGIHIQLLKIYAPTIGT